MNLIFANIAAESMKTGQKNVGQKKGETRGQGQGDKEKISPCLPFALPTCPLCPYFPSPATASELLQVKVVKDNENARTLPPSNEATSLTVNVHVPFPF
jgi:hypothetical protein